MLFWRFIRPGADLGEPLPATYDPFLVLLSFFVASLAGYAALAVVERMGETRSLAGRRGWLAAGAVAMGSGIWSMHFIGMLAFSLPIPVSYDLVVTLISMLPAVFASAMALHFMNRTEIGLGRLNLGGLLMAGGIGGMHYTGMEAMRMEAMMGYDPFLFVLSIAVAHVLAMLALYIKFFRSRQAESRSLIPKVASALVMGSAVACMHYTAMAASAYYPGGSMGTPSVVFEPSWMAVAIALVTTVITGIAIVSTLVDRRMAALSQSLRQSERQSQLILDAAGEGIFGIDPEGKITFVNPAGAHLLGFEPGEARGRPLRSVLEHTLEDGTPCTEETCAMNRTLRDGTPMSVQDEFFHRKDGRPVPVAYTVNSIQDGENVLGAVVTFSDITVRKETEAEFRRAREAAEEASRMKSDFLASMSHEIRTPLNGIVGMTSLLFDTHLSTEQRHYAETVRSSSNVLLDLINDILDFSKIEAGKLSIEPIPFDLLSTLEDTISLFATRAQEREIELVFRYEPEAPRRVVGDPGRIRQIVSNFVSNAVKFTEQGHVLVDVGVESTSDSEATFQIQVQDTGVGIPEERQHVLFGKFMQVDASTTRKYGGTGLGLAISKQLVELMGGTVGVRSREGEGSTFWFRVRLPVDRKSSGLPLPDVALPDLKVLIVDDNPVNREIFEEQVRAWNLRSASAVSADEGMELLRAAWTSHDPFHLALVDYDMPETDGEAFGRMVKKDPDLRDTVLLLVSSAAKKGDAKRAEEAGFAAYLTKPVVPSVLMDAIATAWVSRERKNQVLITRHSLAERETEPSPEASAPKTIRALLVEDHPVNQRVAKFLLEKSGCLVDSAADGREAVDMVEKGEYDVVFMDCQMPEMDGYEATREIRRREAGARRHVPIIAMTAHALAGDRQKCLDAGMDDYVPKPVRRELVDEVLTRWGPAKEEQAAEIGPGTEDGLEPEVAENLKNLVEEGGPEFVAELLESFLRNTRQRITELRDAIVAEDGDQIAFLAHDVKGSAATLGMAALTEPARELERDATAGVLETAEGLLKTLEGAFRRIDEALQAQGEFLRRRSPSDAR